MVKANLGLPGIPIPPYDSIYSLMEIFSSPHLTVPEVGYGLVNSCLSDAPVAGLLDESLSGVELLSEGLVEPAVLSFVSVLVPVAGFVPDVVSVFVESVFPVDGLAVSVPLLLSEGLVEPMVLSFESVLVPVAGFAPVVVSSVVPVDGLAILVPLLLSEGLVEPVVPSD